MTDHHDIDDEDTTMPGPTLSHLPTRSAQVARTGGADADGDATRIDVRRPFDVPDPTEVVVSPPGTHTGSPLRGVPVDAGYGPQRDRAALAADRINVLLDAQETRRRRDRDRDGRPALSVRDVAARRAVQRARHERHLEQVETVRAYLLLLIVFGLLLIVVGAGVVGFGILAGWYTWAPVPR